MDSTLLPKFKFHQLGWSSYRRFTELLSPEDTSFPFSLTNKKNYINSVKFNKINIYFIESSYGEIDFENLLILKSSSDDEFLKYLQKLSKFRPYLRIPRLYNYVYNIEVTKFLLPKTYKKLHYFNVRSPADIDHVADIYYHKDIEFSEGHFIPVSNNTELYRVINHSLNRLPVKEFFLIVDRQEKQDTVQDFIKAIQIPEVVKSITVKHGKYSPENVYEEKWVIIIR